MIYIIEKKYINQDMNIELISYIDNKQNIWFEGKDIAKIFGYSKPRNAIERHVSKNHIKMIQLRWGPRWGVNKMPQIVEVVKRHLNKMTPVVNGAPLSMKPAFMNLYLVLN